MPKLNAVLMALFAVAVIAAMAFLTLRPSPAQAVEPARIQRLVRKLGDADPEVRREGEAGLRQAGTVSIEPLRAAARSADPVLAGRASKLLAELEPGPAVKSGPAAE
jgi:hypothetical protein